MQFKIYIKVPIKKIIRKSTKSDIYQNHYSHYSHHKITLTKTKIIFFNQNHHFVSFESALQKQKKQRNMRKKS